MIGLYDWAMFQVIASDLQPQEASPRTDCFFVADLMRHGLVSVFSKLTRVLMILAGSKLTNFVNLQIAEAVHRSVAT